MPATINGWISSVKIENNAIVTLTENPLVDPHTFTMDVTQGGLTQSVTWRDGRADIDDTITAPDKLWSSEKVQEAIDDITVPPEVYIGDTTPTEDEKIWIKTDEDPITAVPFVRYDIPMTLTDEQKERVRTSIGAGDKEVAVSTTTPANHETIWINPTETQDTTPYVSFAENQTLTAEQKNRARNNIGCVSLEEYNALKERFELLLLDLGIYNI